MNNQLTNFSYAIGNKSENYAELEQRCASVCKKSLLRCTNDKDHEGRHMFTPPDLLSPSTLTKLLLELTSGEIKSRAGLDNIDVIKGHDNFERMRVLTSTLCSIIGPDADSRCNELIKRIDDVETFHKVDFERHLEKGNHRCACLQCAFYCDTDPIECPSKCEHGPPCKKCQDAFEVIAELYEVHALAESGNQDREIYDKNPALEDDMFTWKADISTAFTYLEDYRAHIAHKHSEAEFDRTFYSNLGDVEVVLICDWKMKVLASKYREAQQDWFSKRGSSILGFEIHFKSNDEETKQVLYHFFISDDSFQDTDAVLCAKHFLYSVILPKYGITKVHYRSDGAGCFSSKEAKAAMKVWDDLAREHGGSYEVSYKVTVAGCGKTALDVSTIISA